MDCASAGFARAAVAVSAPGVAYYLILYPRVRLDIPHIHHLTRLDHLLPTPSFAHLEPDLVDEQSGTHQLTELVTSVRARKREGEKERRAMLQLTAAGWLRL